MSAAMLSDGFLLAAIAAVCLVIPPDAPRRVRAAVRGVGVIFAFVSVALFVGARA